MGLIARVIDSSTGEDGEPTAKVEIYQDDNANGRIFNPPGIDSRPLDDDICFTQDSEDTEGGKDVLYSEEFYTRKTRDAVYRKCLTDDSIYYRPKTNEKFNFNASTVERDTKPQWSEMRFAGKYSKAVFVIDLNNNINKER